jgi:hypothetical protein
MKGPYLYLALSLMALSRIQNLPPFFILLFLLTFLISLVWCICRFVAWISGKAIHKPQVAERNIAAQSIRVATPPPIPRGGPPPLPQIRNADQG